MPTTRKYLQRSYSLHLTVLANVPDHLNLSIDYWIVHLKKNQLLGYNGLKPRRAETKSYFKHTHITFHSHVIFYNSCPHIKQPSMLIIIFLGTKRIAGIKITEILIINTAIIILSWIIGKNPKLKNSGWCIIFCVDKNNSFFVILQLLALAII